MQPVSLVLWGRLAHKAYYLRRSWLPQYQSRPSQRLLPHQEHQRWRRADPERTKGAPITGLPSSALDLPAATAGALGGVKAAEKDETDTVEAKIGEDSKLYVPTYPTAPTIPVALNQLASTATEVAGLVTDFN